MAEFKCEVVRVKVTSHPNADRLEIAQVGDFQSIVGKDYVKDGDLAVYIPEGAVVPEWLLKELRLWDETKGKGMCAGSLGNRVKAIKLRGILSQGLIIKGSQYADVVRNPMLITARMSADGQRETTVFYEGEDISEFLGITKYEPKLPSHMVGKALGMDLDITHNYDFDNLKKKPDLFEDGDEVVITEKIHGTLLMVSVVPKDKENERFYRGRVVISSKGLGGRGIILDHNDETNLYAQAVKKHGLLDSMYDAFASLADTLDRPVVLFGEVFGRTQTGACVQDLTYHDEELAFRAFDISIGVRENASFVAYKVFKTWCETIGVNSVPVLYEGPYSKEEVLWHTNGNTTLTDKPHIREGVVVKHVWEERHPKYGRKIAKSVSEAYLLRKEATEYA